jgi:hypothetical protein
MKYGNYLFFLHCEYLPHVYNFPLTTRGICLNENRKPSLRLHNAKHFNILKPTGYGMHQQGEYFNICTLCPHCIYVFCIYLRTNSDLCHLRHKMIGFYNRDEKCLQRGTDWAFK